MKCDKCNHNLPDDSEFCQYCGKKIQTAVSESKTIADEASSTLDEIVVGIASTSDNAIYEDILNNPVEAKTTAIEKRKEQENNIQPDNESEKGLDLAPEKPIDTQALLSVDGDGSAEKPLQTRNEKKTKIRYCSRCGSLIDNESKICTGCHKKYFKIRLKKTSIALIVLTIILTLSIVINFIQYYETKSLLQRVSDLNVKIKKNLIDREELDFYQEYAVLVDENSNRYHKYGCEDFDESSFWIYNIAAAKHNGYYACYKCK